tara:strand:+ start:315 stop:458 length:144 start_codon:yes stop_codon:yes gene_type:complete
MELLTDNWKIITIVILVVDKAVALSPTPYDDMIWTSVKGLLKKLAGK